VMVREALGRSRGGYGTGQLVGSVCCWSAKDGINTRGVKDRVNPGVQLLHVSSQHLSMIGLRNTVEASVKQPEQCLCLPPQLYLQHAPPDVPVRVPAP
jgi:hypothetical protein